MKKTKMIFFSSEKSGLETELTVSCEKNGEIYINIQDPDDRPLSPFADIVLDLETAKAFILYLQQQIELLSDIKNEIKKREEIHAKNSIPAHAKKNRNF